jgi:hypothetical protein
LEMNIKNEEISKKKDPEKNEEKVIIKNNI